MLILLAAGFAGGQAAPDAVIAADYGHWRLAGQETRADAGRRACRLPSANLKKEDFFDILEEINSRSMDAAEPSLQSERQYVSAIRAWLDSLEPGQQERARKIMREAHSDLHALREAIRNKKHELASISFSKGMPPETLPRLGMELQHLRASLGQELRKVSDRLRKEAGVDVDAADAQTFWFVPPEPNVH
ncbi:MAG: hypothetical protein HDQ44_00775 [Desulfovibrio sp.]|nr:hypothetical protein [Desulfovibrio sp.]